jgi:hypothetical protein
MAGPNWKLEDDHKHVTLTLPTEPPTQIVFTTETIEDILKTLGMFRGSMKPEIPKTFAQGQLVQAVADPAWVTEADIMFGSSLLHIRDPRYGWLHYLIPKEEARKLADYLQKQADAPSPGPPQGKPR